MKVITKGLTAFVAMIGVLSVFKANANSEMNEREELNKGLFEELVRNQIYDEDNAELYLRSLDSQQKINLYKALNKSGSNQSFKPALRTTEYNRD